MSPTIAVMPASTTWRPASLSSKPASIRSRSPLPIGSRSKSISIQPRRDFVSQSRRGLSAKPTPFLIPSRETPDRSYPAQLHTPNFSTVPCTNQAESFFARARRGEIGHYHHISGVYLLRYVRELAWREDHRRDNTGQQVRTVVRLVVRSGPSVDFCGYWQRHRHAA